MQRVDLLLAVFDTAERAGQVVAGDGEEAAPVVHLDAAPATATLG